MNQKEIAKKYLLSLTLLFVVGGAVLFVFLLALNQWRATAFGTVQLLGIALLLTLLPLSSYTGFVRAGLKIREIKTKHAVLLVAFFPLVLAAVTLYGLMMLIPSVFTALRACIFRKE